jgi:endonuclease/exonuclease/phosphatase family metal-dependent hydrolase
VSFVRLIASFAATILLFSLAGCAHAPAKLGSQTCLRVATYNVNSGSDPLTLITTLEQIDAQIICLQEADGFEAAYRQSLSKLFPHIYVKGSEENSGAGYAFLSKFPAHEVAWVRNNDWFAGWIMEFETDIGPVQILNVHLHPPVKNRSWVAGYFLTRGDRLQEIKDFYTATKPNVPLIVAGDFNDTGHSRAVRFLKRRGFKNSLPQFDHFSPTWRWRVGPIALRRRMDHILYGPQFQCSSAKVSSIGSSDHFPVTATICPNQAR